MSINNRHKRSWVTKKVPCRVRIGRTLQSFPPSKRSGRLSAHSAFQLGLWTLQGRIHRCRRRGAPAFRPSSAFLSTSVHFHFDRLTLTDLHRVHAITAWHLATTPSPPSSPYAGIFASHLYGLNGVGVPQFHHKRRTSDP